MYSTISSVWDTVSGCIGLTTTQWAVPTYTAFCDLGRGSSQSRIKLFSHKLRWKLFDGWLHQLRNEHVTIWFYFHLYIREITNIFWFYKSFNIGFFSDTSKWCLSKLITTLLGAAGTRIQLTKVSCHIQIKYPAFYLLSILFAQRPSWN